MDITNFKCQDVIKQNFMPQTEGHWPKLWGVLEWVLGLGVAKEALLCDPEVTVVKPGQRDDGVVHLEGPGIHDGLHIHRVAIYFWQLKI